MASTIQAGVAWPAPTGGAVTPGRALFAKGLAKGCTSAHLQSIFSAFGTVTDCQIARHRSGRSAGFAIVTFLRHEEAIAAMQAMDNFLYMGRRLSVKWFSPERALEGSSHSVDVLNMQTLQHALQLSAQLQPADFMAQLAQMLESPRIVPQQPQNAHVAAWLDNFMLTQRDSPLAAPLHDPSQQPSQLDLLNLSALSLTDLSAHSLGNVSTGPACFGTHPATPSSLDVPDGAVFVTTSATPGSNKTSTFGSGSNTTTVILKPNHLVLGHSRLAKWCTAPGPGSAGGRSSAAQSLADDATSDETASVHASDDSSVATTTGQTLAHVSSDAPSCSTEGSSPAMQPLVLSEPCSGTPAAAFAVPATTFAPVCAVATVPPATCIPSMMDTEDVLRSRAYVAAAAVAANNRPGVVGSDPGNMQQALNRPPTAAATSAAAVAAAAAAGFPTGVMPPSGAVLPGVPALPPLRTFAHAPPHSLQHPHPHHHHHHHHHHHLARGAMQQQGRTAMPMFSSCGGGGGVPAAAAAAATATASPDACLQQALRFQQALAEQTRTMNAQQQYVDALAKLAAAREQVMAAASLLNGSGGMSAAGLPVPQALAQQHHPNHHHHHRMAAPGAMSNRAGPIGAYMNPMGAAATPSMRVNQYLSPSASAPSNMPDLGTLLMFQNASMSRPLY